MLRKFRAAVRNRESGGNDLNKNSEQRKFKLKVIFWDICYVKEDFTENASSKTALRIRLSSTHLSEEDWLRKSSIARTEIMNYGGALQRC